MYPTGLFADEPIGAVTTVIKTAYLQRSGNPTEIVVRQGATTHLLDTYQTMAGSRLKILFEDDSIISMAENSKIVITSDISKPSQNERSRVIEMITGSIRVLIGKRFLGGASKFEVHTPTSTAGVRGTHFIAWVQNQQVAEIPISGILVLEGEVEVKPLPAPAVDLKQPNYFSGGGSITLMQQQTVLVKLGDSIGQSMQTLRIAPSDLTARLLAATAVPDQISQAQNILQEKSLSTAGKGSGVAARGTVPAAAMTAPPGNDTPNRIVLTTHVQFQTPVQ